jgi:hypothetical protein
MTSAIEQLLRIEDKLLRDKAWIRVCQAGMMAYAIVQSLIFTALCLNHLGFPLSLDGLELTRLDQVQRLLMGQVLYASPTADAVPLVSTPLYYYLCAPIVGFFGPSLPAMRLVSLVGVGLSGLSLFIALRRKLASPWWATIGLGLFSASYASLDGSIDNAHPDSWLVTMILLGAVFIDLGRSRRQNFLGMVCFVLAFWFKQHGALFAVAGLVYVTWRQGWRRSWEAWLLVVAAGLLYGAGPGIFGPAFHEATWQQPRSWMNFEPETLLRVLGFSLRHYPLLAIAALTAVGQSLLQSDRPPSVWSFLFPAAVLTGFMGALDGQSLNNIFLPLALWYIIAGLIGLRLFTQRLPYGRRWRLRLVALGISFGLLLYNPTDLAVSGQAAAAYEDLLGTLGQLSGPIYVPTLGPLPIAQVSPRASIQSIDGWVRSWPIPPDRNPLLNRLLGPALSEDGSYLLLMSDAAPADGVTADSNVTSGVQTDASQALPSDLLTVDRLLSPWIDRYHLDRDFGDRFIALRAPHRPGIASWPRYLLRQGPAESRPAWFSSPANVMPDAVPDVMPDAVPDVVPDAGPDALPDSVAIP